MDSTGVCPSGRREGVDRVGREGSRSRIPTSGPVILAGLLAFLVGGCATTERTAPATDAGAGLASAESGSAVEPPAGAARRAGAPQAAEPTGAAGSPGVHGFLATRYEGRSEGGARDHDLYHSASIDIGEKGRDPFTAHIMGRVSVDLDGQSDRENQFVFPSLADGYDQAVHGLLYHAYVDAGDGESLDKLRVGRQTLYETPELVLFDGVRLETTAHGDGRFQWGLYGGVPAHLYESSAHGDRVFGTHAQASPWKGGRLRFDWMHLEDPERLGTAQNDLLGLSLQQDVAAGLKVDGRYTRLEEEDRDVRVKANYVLPDVDLSFQASYYELLEAQRNFAFELNPFFSSLQTYFPYNQIGGLISKGIGDAFELELGANVRRVDDDADIGQFNRDFERYFMTASAHDVLAEGLALSLTGDVYESEGQDIRTWGADVSRAFDEQFELSGGTYYSLFKYDLFLDEEREDVRTYFLRLRYRRSKSLRFDIGYEYEDDDQDEYHQLRVGSRWNF